MTAWRRPAVIVDSDRRLVEQAFVEHSLPAPVWFETTEDDPGHGQTLEALANGADLILACGGDGTVRACGAALAGGTVPLGLLPAGTGNLLARNLDLPRDLSDAVSVLASGATRSIDVVYLDDQAFLVMSGSGFDALLFEETSDQLKDTVGWAAYVVAGFRAIGRARRADLRIDVDGDVRHLRAVGAVIGNVGTLTAGIELMSDAEADDGCMHAAVMVPVRVRDWVGLGARLLARAPSHPYQLRHLSGRSITLSWERSMPAELDDDLIPDRDRLTYSIRPRSLQVACGT